jgi:hypothetical protein
MEEIQRQLTQRYEGAKHRKVSGLDIILKAFRRKRLVEQTLLKGNLPGLCAYQPEIQVI